MTTKTEKAYIKSAIPNKKVSDKILDMIDAFDAGGSGEDVPNYSSSFNSTSDWIANGSFYEISINQTVHLKGLNPIVQVFETVGSDYEKIELAIIVAANGNVKIQTVSNLRFNGKIIIS